MPAATISNEAPRSTFLSRGDEIAFFAIPILILLFAAGVEIFAVKLGREFREGIIFFVLIFGLQKAHNAFSFPLIFLPQLKAWRKKQLVRRNKNYLMQWALIGVLVTGVYLTHSITYDLSFWRTKLFEDLTAESSLWLIFWLVNYWHTFSQFFGLSMLINAEFDNPNEVAKSQMKTAVTLERKLFKLLIVFATIGLAHNYVFPLSGMQLWFFGLGSFFFTLAILANTFRYPQELRRKKFIFSLRLLLIPLRPFSFVAALGLNLNHNLEYLIISKTMIQRAKVQVVGLFFWISVLWVGLVVALALANPESLIFLTPLKMLFREHPTIKVAMVVGSISITTIHFFLDGYFFHFSDPITREYIKPLLILNPASPTVAAEKSA